MNPSEMITEIVLQTFNRANAEIPGFEALAESDLPLFDVPGAVLDSLNLISFVFILEEEFAARTGKKIKITTEDVLATHNAPFRNVGALSQFLLQKMESAC